MGGQALGSDMLEEREGKMVRGKEMPGEDVQTHRGRTGTRTRNVNTFCSILGFWFTLH